MSISKAIARAWTDADYKTKLLSDPHGALTEAGVDIPEGVKINVVENMDGTKHLVLPVPPVTKGEVALEELENLVGGYVAASFSCGGCP